MMRWAGLILALPCFAQQAELPPEILLLGKIKARVAENLKRLPNFTCTETIQRSLWHKSEATPEMIDTVRLEVAFVQGKELYGWPGAARIDEPDIGKMINGSFSNGYFALFLNNIFLVSSTTFHFVGHTKRDDRDLLQYDYVVPRLAGAYRLRTSRGDAAVVGYHGSFWVADGAADPLRIEVTVDDVPIEIGFSSATSVLEYGPVTIGSNSYVLPQAAEFMFADTNGNQHRSHLGFQACQEFVGESVVKFGPPSVPPSVRLPDEFTAQLILLTPIDSATAAGGDPILATLHDDIKSDGKIIVPKDARVSGRIAHFTKNGPVYILDFVFTSIDFDGGHADLTARTNDVGIEDWQRIHQLEKWHLARGARIALRSAIARSDTSTAK